MDRWILESGTRDSGPGVRDPGSGAGCPGPGTDPGTQMQESKSAIIFIQK